jgi:hypothetical protein
MDTSEYTGRKERKRARKITRHSVFQKMRQRAIAAESQVAELRIEVKTLDDALQKSKRRLQREAEAAVSD